MQLDGKNITAAGKLRLLTLDHLDGRTAAAKRARESGRGYRSWILVVRIV